MRKIRLLILGLLILLAAALIGAQRFLARGLTQSLQSRAQALFQARGGLNAGVGRVGVNLPGGSFTVHGAQVGNPPGFDGPLLRFDRLKLTIGLPALWRGGGADIRKAGLRGGELRIVRNRDGVLNVKQALDAWSGAGAPAQDTSGDAPPGHRPAAGATPFEVPPMMLRQGSGSLTVRYTDEQAAEPPFALTLDIQVRLRDVATYGRPDVLNGILNLSGYLTVAGQRCAFDWNGRLGPAADPARLSLDGTGSMQALDLAGLQPLARRYGIESGRLSATVALSCRGGVFDSKASALHVTVDNLELTADGHAHYKNLPLPKRFKVIVPVGGTLTAPQLDIAGALLGTLAGQDKLGQIIRQALSAPEPAAPGPLPAPEPPADEAAP